MNLRVEPSGVAAVLLMLSNWISACSAPVSDLEFQTYEAHLDQPLYLISVPESDRCRLRVVDSDGPPIEGAAVRVVVGGALVTTEHSTPDGCVHFDVPEELDLDIHVAHDAYSSRSLYGLPPGAFEMGLFSRRTGEGGVVTPPKGWIDVSVAPEVRTPSTVHYRDSRVASFYGVASGTNGSFPVKLMSGRSIEVEVVVGPQEYVGHGGLGWDRISAWGLGRIDAWGEGSRGSVRLTPVVTEGVLVDLSRWSEASRGGFDWMLALAVETERSRFGHSGVPIDDGMRELRLPAPRPDDLPNGARFVASVGGKATDSEDYVVAHAERLGPDRLLARVPLEVPALASDVVGYATHWIE